VIEPEGAPIRIVIADDQRLLREGLASILSAERSIQVVGLAANGQEAVDLAGQLAPDVVLMDIRMPVMDGIEAIQAIKAAWPKVKIIILTSFLSDGYVVEGLMAGADGYVLKDTSPAALISSIHTVHAGGQVVESGVAQRVAALLAKQNHDRNECYDGMTTREVQLLAMVARGMAAKEIAHALRISEKTVRNHISNIYRKLGIYDRSQAVIYAMKKGLVAMD